MLDCVRKIEVGEMKSNCYLCFNETREKCLIIDPGDDADYVERVIADYDVSPIAIIATHGHFDHILAVTEIKLAYQIPFLMHKEDSFLLSRMQSTAKHYLGIETLPAPRIDIELKPGNTRFSDWNFKVISIPGHTPGSIAIYFPEESIAFVGDLMFSDNYVGRTDFKYSDKNELLKSIKIIKDLPEGTVIYPGHGDEFVL